MTDQLPRVVGTNSGSCCWCMDKPYTKVYQATDSQNEQVLYMVCNDCYTEFAPEGE